MARFIRNVIIVEGVMKVIKELENLQYLAKAMESNVIKFCETMKETARNLVPVDTGSLRSTIGWIKLTELFYQVSAGIYRDGDPAKGMVVNPKTHRVVDYESFVERDYPYFYPAFYQAYWELRDNIKGMIRKIKVSKWSYLWGIGRMARVTKGGR